MTVDPAHDAPRPLGDGVADAVTVAFGDAPSGTFGLLHVSCSVGPGGAPSADGLGVLFRGGRPVIARAEQGAAAGEEWGATTVAGARTTVSQPLGRWTAGLDGGEQGGFDLELEAACAPAAIADDHAVVRAGGSAGFEQLCTVRGRVREAGRQHDLVCRGQRRRSWHPQGGGRTELVRSVSAWFDDGSGVFLTAARGRRARTHADEALAAHLVVDGEPRPVVEPRLSTTSDATGRPRHAGLELWVGEEDEWPHRAAGELLAATSLDLGDLRWDAAFFRWWMEGREGVGRYDVVRAAR